MGWVGTDDALEELKDEEKRLEVVEDKTEDDTF